MPKKRFKKPKLSKIKEKMDSIHLKKPDFSNFKERIDNVAIKYRLEKLNRKIDTLESMEPLNPIREKYKGKTLLEKTRRHLKSYSALEEIVLNEEDISDLQANITQMTSELKVEKPKEVTWESIKTFKSIEKEKKLKRQFTRFTLKDYWINEFKSLFQFYMQRNDINEVATLMKWQPIFKRILDKVLEFKDLYIY